MLIGPDYKVEHAQQAMTLIGCELELPLTRHQKVFDGVLYDAHISHSAVGTIYCSRYPDGQCVMTGEIVSVGIGNNLCYIETINKSRYVIAQTQKGYNQLGDLIKDLTNKRDQILANSDYYTLFQWSDGTALSA